MSEAKTDQIISFLKESVFGNNFTVVPAGTTTYSFGDFYETITFSEKYERTPIYDNQAVNPSSRTRGRLVLDLPLNFLLVDGQPLYYAMGKTTDSDEGAYYKHLIVKRDKTDELPSWVTHTESEDPGSVSSIYKDYFGCRVNEFQMTAIRHQPLIFNMGAFAVDFSTSGNKQTVTPTFKSAAGTEDIYHQAYYFQNGAYTWNSGEITPILGFGFTILNNTTRRYIDRATTYYRPKYIKGGDQFYVFTAILYLENKSFMDELKAQAEKTFEMTFTREDANDSIKVTLSNSVINSCPFNIQPRHEGDNTYQITGDALTCAIEVRDQISAY
jgi:hypothetical protein